MTQVQCTRCARDAPAIEGGVFYTPALENELKAHVCGDCWNEWQRAEVMVINELKLNFMDPQALPRLIAQMRELKNPTRWCSIGCMTAAARLAKPSAIELIDYRQAVDEQGNALVSSASMALLA